MQRLHDSAERAGHRHRRLVRLERDERLLRSHGVAGFDQHFDHRHILEIADVGYAHLGHARRSLRGRRRRRHRGPRRWCSHGAVGLDGEQDTSFADFVSDLHPERLDQARHRRRHVHRGLVRFERHERIFGFHAIAGLHQDFDHRHFREVADVRDFDFCGCTHVSPQSWLVHTVHGSGRSAARPYFLMAASTCFASMTSSSASALSAATAT